MVRRFLAVVPIVAIVGVGCVNELGPPESEDLTLIDLKIVANSDTLLLLTGDTKTLNVQGTYVRTEENTVMNEGVLTDTAFTFFSTDTVIRTVDASDLAWHSSDGSVAGVSKGKVEALNAGITAVTASGDGVESNAIYIRVSMGAPELIVDPPLTQLVFQNSGTVSGWVLAGINLSLTMNGDTINYSDEGRFVETVALEVGENSFKVVATNNDNGLSVARTKLIVYYPIDEAGITGHWMGETLTRPFSFDIVYEPLSGEYIIDGTLTVDLTVLGGPLVVEDIVIVGLINRDGTIDAALSKESSGFILGGTLEGIFYSSGTAGGSYTVTLEKEGWPTVSHTETWTAERE
ncbi:MAG: hypothetical protein ACE5GH_00635 [Fidelibacterota bacterium]